MTGYGFNGIHPAILSTISIFPLVGSLQLVTGDVDEPSGLKSFESIEDYVNQRRWLVLEALRLRYARVIWILMLVWRWQVAGLNRNNLWLGSLCVTETTQRLITSIRSAYWRPNRSFFIVNETTFLSGSSLSIYLTRMGFDILVLIIGACTPR
jgi:hypothetical protein